MVETRASRYPTAGLLISLVVSSLAFAGCVSTPDETPTAEPDALVVSDPRDYSYLKDNNTSGAHIHDYWGKLERMPILEETQRVGISWNGAPRSFAEFLPPDDVTIPMGAARVEVTMAWEDNEDNNHGIPELWIRTANQSQERFVAEIENGVPTVFNSTNDDNDLPHQLLSAWEFHFYLKLPEDESRIEFSSDLTTTVWAERGLPIPLFPGHPDQWQGRDEIALFGADTEVETAWIGDSEGAMNCFSGCLDTHTPLDRAVVPLDADHVTFTFTYDQTTASRVAFYFHSSDTREWTLLEDDQDLDPWVDTYEVPVEDLMGDGPYATQSLWKVRIQGLGHGVVYGATDQSICSGCETVPFNGAYNLTATVHR